MTRRLIVLILLSITLLGQTACMTGFRGNREGSTVLLDIRSDDSLPDDAKLDFYVDGNLVGQIIDHKIPEKMVLLSGMHSFRLVSEEHAMEGWSQVVIMGQGSTQTVRINVKKKIQ